ncbi:MULTISPECIES: fimbrial protein [Serratia]|uniref:fimbrial protein n=1 Tax=Serratia TaxID=613 RepID=UPI002164E814|nr:fimbrial protein [Serratia marcescens]
MDSLKKIAPAAVALLFGAMALPAESASTVTVSVTVLAPLPCVINESKPITVDFGDDVMTTRIDGNNYRVPVEYGLTCSSTPVRNEMRLQIAGNAAGFDGRLLKTSVNGLGIALLRDGVRIPLNSWQNFTYPDLPRLEAVPVKQSGSGLPTGEFTSSATLRVDYQ